MLLHRQPAKPQTLADLGIAREINRGRRNRLFTYDGALAILRVGAEPL
ncbi:hypothetical protein NZK32_05420 [Cyanobium sp. FGCU-52]|nr:hypothetical protein [Cyanobium sp. FGCU52]